MFIQPVGSSRVSLSITFSSIEPRSNLKDKRDRIKSDFRTAHDIKERHPWQKVHMHVRSLKPPPMASRDTQGPFINTVSVGIYGPTALYKLAQWGALNKLWTRWRAPEIRYRSVHYNEDMCPLISSLVSGSDSTRTRSRLY